MRRTKFTAPATDVYLFETGGSQIDTILYTLDGCDGEALTCVDDISQDNVLSFNIVPMQAGQTVAIVVDGYNASGEVTLNVDVWLDPDTAYGDCLNGADDACGDGEFCVTNEAETLGVCTYGDCTVAEHCPAAPDSGTAVPACIELVGGDFGQCYLSCENGETCPDGMVCDGGVDICVYEAAT